MASPALLNALAAGDNPTAGAFAATAKNLQTARAEDFRQGQLEKDVASKDAIDLAIRQSAMPAPVPTQSQPSPQQPVGQAPAAQPAVAAAPAMASASPAFTAAPPATTYSGQPMPSANPASVQLSPFDTPEFTANLQRRLASTPGGGTMLLQMRKERDAQIASVLEMVANGNGEAARFLAKQNGLNIPDVMFQNADVARGMTLAQKAYPDEPQKGQMFFQSFIATPGGLQEKVNAGMRAGGAPTTAAQRQLNNSIALLQWKAANPQVANAGANRNPYDRYKNIPGVGLVDVGADGGPSVVLQGGGFNYQETLQKNLDSIAKSSFGKSPDQLYAEAKDLTDRMAASVQQSARAPAPTPASSGFLAPPPSGTGTPDPRMFSAQGATPSTATLPAPGANRVVQQLPTSQGGGNVTVRNPRTGQTFVISNPTAADIQGAKADGFEVVQ